MHLAARDGTVEAVKLLLDANADVQAKDIVGSYHIAWQCLPFGLLLPVNIHHGLAETTGCRHTILLSMRLAATGI